MFDPRPLVHLAEELGQSGTDNEEPSEVKLRTAVGRFYYAVFLVARERTRVVGRESVHGAVVYQVRRLRGTLVADRLDELKDMREAADYEFPPANPEYADWRENWRKAKRLAEQLLEKLQVRR